MSAIKKMNQDLEKILGREPTIHEQIDIIILNEVKNRLVELQLTYQMQPNEEIKEEYQRVAKSLQEIQDRNPEIFGGIDSDGGDHE